ncbi:MAG TPA: hypothetical protein VIG06_10725 [Kofleriaceae bacterium]
MGRGRHVAAALALCAGTGTARAQDFPAVADRDFTIDLHQGAVLGSGRIIGMGGAAQALAQGSAGALFNPAAPAARADTSTRNFDWDFHIDILNTSLGSDFDNNGIKQETEFGFLKGPIVTGGLVGQYGCWGLGGSLVFAEQQLEERADGSTVVPSAVVGRVSLARAFFDYQLMGGIGIRAGTFGMQLEVEDGRRREDLFSITGSALEAGAIWRPRDLDLRAGAAGSLPVSSEQVESEECDPLDCEGFILPDRAALPWQVSMGGAWRFGPTPWNRVVAARWRDEKALIVAADLVVTGRVPDGYGLEAFARQELQPSGRSISWSPRAGAEYEWVPGRFRLRAGAYWEPARFRDPAGKEIIGRAHGTLGLDLRVWQFHFWGKDFRLRMSITGDAARDYGNGGLSLGFWG